MLDYKYNNLHLIVNYILFCMLNYICIHIRTVRISYSHLRLSKFPLPPETFFLAQKESSTKKKHHSDIGLGEEKVIKKKKLLRFLTNFINFFEFLAQKSSTIFYVLFLVFGHVLCVLCL